MALTVVLTRKPVCKVPEDRGVEELYLEASRSKALQASCGSQSVFLAGGFPIADRLFKRWDRPFAVAQDKPFGRGRTRGNAEARKGAADGGSLDRPAPGVRRELGRDPAALDLFADCAQEPGLPSRSPGACEGSRVSKIS